MKEFNLEDYRNFIKKHLIDDQYIHLEKYIDALCQFEQIPKRYLDASGYMYGYKRMFGKLVIDKPDKVPLNSWFLHLYGSFKYCISCKKIHKLEDFEEEQLNWDKKKNICKESLKNNKINL